MKYFLDGEAIAGASPDAIRSQARQMSTAATRIDTVAGMLQKVSTRGAWESPAGDAFAAKVGSTPSDLFGVANRLRESAQIIRRYADQLETSQRAVSDCDTSAHTAHTTLREKDEELAGMSQDDPDRPRVTADRGEAAGDLSRAERRFEREKKQAHADESRMAARLYEVCEKDGDSVLYDYFEWMTDAGGTASDAGIIARPIALAGVIEPIGMAGRRAVYGEGSYGDVAKSSVGYGVDTISFGAGRVVKKAKQRFEDKEVSRVPGLSSNPVRVKDNPIIAPPKRHYTHQRTRIPAVVRDTVHKTSGADDITEAFRDWEAIAGEGRVARVAVAVQLSAKQGNRVRKTTTGTAGALNGSGANRKAQEQEEAKRRQEIRARRAAEDKVSFDPPGKY